jgi:hypothetical protein
MIIADPIIKVKNAATIIYTNLNAKIATIMINFPIANNAKIANIIINNVVIISTLLALMVLFST